MEIIDIPFHNQFNVKIKAEYGKTCYNFSTDMKRIDSMIQWLFENTNERFVLLGTDRIYFKSSEDAMAFKIVWL